MLWQSIPIALYGLAEVLAAGPMFSFFYEESPEGLKSTGQTLAVLVMCYAGVQSLLLQGWSSNLGFLPNNLNDGHLELFYFGCAAVQIVNIPLFMLYTKWYMRK